MAIVRELSLKFAHRNGDTSTMKLSPLQDISSGSTTNAAIYRERLKEINSGSFVDESSTRVDADYQDCWLSKSGSPAVSITAATYTETDTVRIYTRGAN